MDHPLDKIAYRPLGNGRKEGYSRLYARFILLTLICSVFPILVVGWGIYVYYSNFSTERMVEYFQRQAQYHQKLIELFINEREYDVELIASSHSLDYLRREDNLVRIFDLVNRDVPFFEDFGVLNAQGKHLSYVGPFDLMANDYSQAFWFKAVMEKGTYISDMFIGYRGIPHFVIAVANTQDKDKWILRATINADSFRELVEDVKMGDTGEVFLVNRDGFLQTSRRFGNKILEKAPLSMETFTGQSGVSILEPDGVDASRRRRQIMAYTRLKKPEWTLVVRQDYAEVFQQVNHANRAMLFFLHVSILVILIVTLITTRHMIQVVKKRDEHSDELDRQLMQAGKLASLGELAAGVAHEINNPLAVIMAGNQVIRDSCGEVPEGCEEFKAKLLDFLSHVDAQVLRCSTLTHDLLGFARRSASVVEKADVNACLKEVIELMERRAESVGVNIVKNLDDNLPQCVTDPSQLQQVFTNLIANAIDAHEGKPDGMICVTTRSDGKQNGVRVSVADKGAGISLENMKKIFDPFFTTKPVGKGTGLGLSISHSIVKNLGGNIQVRSTAGAGTEFTVFLPFFPDLDIGHSLHDGKVHT